MTDTAERCLVCGHEPSSAEPLDTTTLADIFNVGCTMLTVLSRIADSLDRIADAAEERGPGERERTRNDALCECGHTRAQHSGPMLEKCFNECIRSGFKADDGRSCNCSGFVEFGP